MEANKLGGAGTNHACLRAAHDNHANLAEKRGV